VNTKLCVYLGFVVVATMVAGCVAPVAPPAPAPTQQAAPQPTAPQATAPQAEACENWKDWKTIRIGVPTLITGPGAPLATDIIAGIGMAVERINAEGGVLGKPLELVYTDLKATAAEDCALGAEVMNRANVSFISGGPFWGPACIDEFGRQKGGVPLFHESATKILVDKVKANGYTNIFQMCPSELDYATNGVHVLADVLPVEYPNKKVALLGGDTSYDTVIREAASKLFKDAGWEVILDDTYTYGNTEFGAQLAKIRAENPAIIFGVITSSDSAVAFVNQFQQNPTDSMVYLQFSPSSPEFIPLLGEKANGVVWQTLAGYLPTEENKQWAAEFKKEFGREPGTLWGPIQEDYLRIWKAAAEAAGSPCDYDKINQYIADLSKHPYKGRAGTYGMEGYEAPGGDDWIPMQFTQVQDQAHHVIYLGTKPVEGEEFQLPPWFK